MEACTLGTSVSPLRILGLLVAVGLGLLAYGNFHHASVIQDRAWRRLAGCRSLADLQDQCQGNGGTTIQPGSGWIAIAYEDDHGPGEFSYSLAVDSRGRFYQRWYHYCGSYGFLNHSRAALRGPDSLEKEAAEKFLDRDPFFRAERSGDLDAAVRILKEEGFRETVGLGPPAFLDVGP